MTVTQKRIALVVAAIGLVYFVIFIFPNALGAKSETMLQSTSGDETVMYPVVLRMLQDPSSFKDFFTRWVIYGDYHYGWLFYMGSAAVLLPVKAVYGMGFANHPQLNLLLMRQLISVLPMVLTIIGLVYLQTRFKSWLKTMVLLILLLSIRAVVRMNIQFWHPDELSVLAVVITLFLLERDRLRFGKNFYFAAAACGAAIGIKLAGVFFAGTIAVYLLAGMIKRVLNLKQALVRAGLFLLIMGVALVLSDPFLYNQGARAELIKIQTYKTQELTSATGYPQDYTADYALGPQHWTWTLQTFFGSWPLLGFVFLSLLAGCFWGPNKLLNRLILTYIVPQSIYLLYFVAPKPSHYWLPVILPLFSAMLCLPEAIKDLLAQHPSLKLNRSKLTLPAVSLVVALIMGGFFITNLTRYFSGAYASYTTGLAVEQNLSK